MFFAGEPCDRPDRGAGHFGIRYKSRRDVRLNNGTLTAMVVVLEPISFSITPDGEGVFRPLDRDIHIDLSAMSARLEPGQTYYVFYKTHADHLPAWFRVYSTFSSPQHRPGMDVRIMLPHTLYLYQKKPLVIEELNVASASWEPGAKKIVCDVENRGFSLVRVQDVRISGPMRRRVPPGFPSCVRAGVIWNSAGTRSSRRRRCSSVLNISL
jgi:hypothetical protein